MSLQLAAQHLASRGRGPDTTLVHMAPQEVAGLQALAKAAGGTLTTNPDTGLPEAGFLSSILPMVAGAALASTGVGAPMAAMLVGGGMTVATGSLQKGLMAGLGAYGGAGLGGALMGAGEAASIGAAQQAAMGEATAQAAQQAAQTAIPQAASATTAAAAPASVTGIPGFQGSAVGLTPAPAAAAPIQAAEAVQAAAPQTVTQMPTQAMLNEAAARVTPGSTLFDPAMASRLTPQLSGLEKLGAGVKNIGALTTGEQLKYGAMLGLPLLAGAMEPKQTKYAEDGPNPYNFRFDWERPSGPSYDSREAAQLRGNLRPITAMADGGPVGEMSEKNQMLTLMANGGQMYAEGGETKSDVAKGMTGASADAFRYLMGQAAQSPATIAAQQYGNQVAAPTPPATPTAPTMSSSEASLRGMFGKVAPLNTLTNMLADSFFGPQAVGVMREDPNQPYSFNFNPATGQMVAAPRAMRPVTVTPDPGSYAAGGIAALAAGGASHLGDYSDGGRLLKGPGDGVSDSIPATIADKRPARLADGEFVVPARIVSELGNGSTDAGARKLYAMMDRVQKARGKTVGKQRVAVDSRADKALPA